MKARKLFQGIAACATVALGLIVPAAAGADTFTVDSAQGSGPGTLRQAVLDANANPGHDKIVFVPGLTVADADGLQITGDVEIDGPGRGSLQVFGGTKRAFVIKAGASATISGMTISHGIIENDVGAAVLNQGSLVLDDVLVTQNEALAHAGGKASGGAVANTGTLTIKNSGLTGNFAQGDDGGGGVSGGVVSGGAVFNSGTATLDHVSIANNVVRAGNTTASGGLGASASGGGIENTGDLTVVDSTVAQNLAGAGDARDEGGTGLGGAIHNHGHGKLTLRRSTLNDNIAGGGGGGVAGGATGGAIFNDDPATFQIENSTITNNSAIAGAGSHQTEQGLAGGINNQSAFGNNSSIVATTIAKNDAYRGANIFNSSASLSLKDTIITSPRTPGGDPGQNCGHPSSFPSAIQSLGYNLDSDGSCELKKTGDQANKDPQLKNLADNGGPTQTMAIPLSSPALDQGVSGGLTTDQRGDKRPVIVPGVPRPQGGDGADIGAYEYQPGPAGHSRIKGSVRPGRTHARERTCFKFEAKRQSGDPMAKVQVKMGGKRARTDEHGKATICKRFKHAGTRHPRLRKRGHERAKLRVNVRP